MRAPWSGDSILVTDGRRNVESLPLRRAGIGRTKLSDPKLVCWLASSSEFVVWSNEAPLAAFVGLVNISTILCPAHECPDYSLLAMEICIQHTCM